MPRGNLALGLGEVELELGLWFQGIASEAGDNLG